MRCEPYKNIEYIHNDDIIDAGPAMNAVRYITFDADKVEARRAHLTHLNRLAREKREAEAHDKA